GVRFTKQTVLYNVEGKAFAERKSGLFVSSNVEVPAVEFGDKIASSRPLNKPARESHRANPIRKSMQIVENSRGNMLDLRLRYPMPLYYEPPGEEPLNFDPEFLLTSAASWNEDQPFPSRERTPRFEPPKQDDPTRGTLDEKRRGPFPVGIAFETKVPLDWYT